MKTRLSLILAIIVVSFAAAGCSTTSPIISEWRNPAYVSSSLKRIMVGSLGSDTSIRRNFEDEFSLQLRAAGIEGMPSYRYLAEDEKIGETKLKQAAMKAGADALIFARSIHVEQKTRYGPGYLPYTSFGIFGSHVGATWQGLGGAPTVYRYNEYVSETTLLDLAKNQVAWTGTIKTAEPDDARAAIRTYVQAVMKALEAQDLVRPRH
jgi:hypothetical protein